MSRFLAIPFFAAVVAAVAMLAGGADASSLPAVAAPADSTVRDTPAGGRTLVVPVAGVTSGADTFRGGIRAARTYFDRTPRILDGMRSHDGNVTIALFETTLKRAAVEGLAVARYTASGGSITYLFDTPDRLGATLPAMEASLAQHVAASQPSSSLESRWWAAANRGRDVAVSPVSFPDQSAEVGVASGFTPNPGHVGAFTAKAVDDAFLRIGGGFSLSEPGSANVLGFPTVAYSQDVATAWIASRRAVSARQGAPDEHLTVDDRHGLRVQGTNRSEILFGTGTQFGKRMAYAATVTTIEPTRGLWSLGFGIMWAPLDAIETDVPKLYAMAHSYHAHQDVQNGEISAMDRANTEREQDFARASVASNTAARVAQQARFDGSMAQSAESRTYISQQGAAADAALQGKVFVGSTDSSGHPVHLKIPIENADGYAMVPASQLREGIDY
jgi:hypothetical protein